MTKEELKKKYDPKSIKEIEAIIKGEMGNLRDAQYLIIEVLFYLEVSGRWKENPDYKTATFKQYLSGMLNMKYATYKEMFRAYNNFRSEVKRFGVGLVAKVKRECGALNEKRVLSEIKKAQPEGKPINQQKIEQIIKKNSTQRKKEPQPYVDWKNKYITEAEAHNETKKELREARAQIERLKKRVLELQELDELKKAVMPFVMNTAFKEQHVTQ